jgi:inositol-phosphate transport system substrate-binding protein
MKRMLSVIAAAVLSLNLAACGGNAAGGSAAAKASTAAVKAAASDSAAGNTKAAAGTSKAAASGTEENITLKLSFNGDFKTMAEAVINAADRLNKKYAAEGKKTTVKVDADYQTIDNNDFHNNIVFAHKSGDASDIFICDADVAGYVKAGCVLDITDAMTDALVKDVTKPCTVDGKVYAMPFDLPLRVVYYNTNDLKKIGWTDDQISALPKDIASGKVTLEDFTALCGEVVKKGGATYGLVHRPNAGNDFYDLLNALGGDYFDGSGKLVFDEAGIKRMFQYLYDNAQTSKITPSNLNQMGWDTINKMVGTGEAFAYFGPMFSATYVAKAAGLDTNTFASQEAFVLFPKSADSKAAFCTAAPQFMAISARTKYPDVCKDIFRELQKDSADLLAHHCATTFSLSSVKAANDLPEIKNSPILKPVTYMVDYAQSVPAVQNSSALRGLIFTEISSLELGQKTPDQAIGDLKKQAELNINGIIMK